MLNKRYRVSFYYYTDCRACWSGEAANELAALVLAQATVPDARGWCDNGDGFKVIIERIFAPR